VILEFALAALAMPTGTIRGAALDAAAAESTSQ